MDNVESRRERKGAARKLILENVAIAQKSSSNERFNEKFSHPRRNRVNESLPASPFPYILTKWRDRSGLLAKEAANLIGVSVHTYRGWEYGKHLPSRLAREEINRVIKSYKR